MSKLIDSIIDTLSVEFPMSIVGYGLVPNAVFMTQSQIKAVLNDLRNQCKQELDVTQIINQTICVTSLAKYIVAQKHCIKFDQIIKKSELSDWYVDYMESKEFDNPILFGKIAGEPDDDVYAPSLSIAEAMYYEILVELGWTLDDKILAIIQEFYTYSPIILLCMINNINIKMYYNLYANDKTTLINVLLEELRCVKRICLPDKLMWVQIIKELSRLIERFNLKWK